MRFHPRTLFVCDATSREEWNQFVLEIEGACWQACGLRRSMYQSITFSFVFIFVFVTFTFTLFYIRLTDTEDVV